MLNKEMFLILSQENQCSAKTCYKSNFVPFDFPTLRWNSLYIGFLIRGVWHCFALILAISISIWNSKKTNENTSKHLIHPHLSPFYYKFPQEGEISSSSNLNIFMKYNSTAQFAKLK